MNIRSAKQKGRRLASKLRESLMNRLGLHSDDILVTSSSVNGPDLFLSSRAKEKFPFAIECKNQEKINVWDALKQAESHVKGDESALLVFSRNRSEVYACLKLKDFLKWGSNGK